MAIHRLKRIDWPLATPDVAGIIYNSWCDDDPIEIVVANCQSQGAKSVTVEFVKTEYEGLDKLFEKARPFFVALQKRLEDLDKGSE